MNYDNYSTSLVMEHKMKLNPNMEFDRTRQ